MGRVDGAGGRPGRQGQDGQVDERIAKPGEHGFAIAVRSNRNRSRRAEEAPDEGVDRVLPRGRRSSIYACLVGGMAWGPAAEYASRIATASLRLPPISHRYD
jgi:hypothetical protein